VEVAVAGVGIAGAFLLRGLNRNIKAVGIDKREKLGYPVECGEIVPFKEEMKILLPDLEDYSLFDIPKRYESNKTKFISFTGPDGKEFVVDFKMHVVERDRMISEVAEKSGHEILKSSRIIRFTPLHSKSALKLENGVVKAEVVAGCDGANSRIASALKVRKLTVVPSKQYVMENVECDEDTVYMFVGKKIAAGGYAWIIPKGNGIANVGVGFVRQKAERGDNIIKALERFIKEYPHSSIFLKHARVLSEIGAVVPVDLPLEKTVHGKTLLVGDAASMVISHVGAGIPTSMIAGDVAARIINECFESGEFSRLESFDERWRKLMLGAMERAYFIKSLWDKISESDEKIAKHFKLLSDKDMWNILHARIPFKLKIAPILLPLLNLF
jgi:geranylgeranyl reductase family protein